MKNKVLIVLRWAFFVPISIGAAYLVQLFMDKYVHGVLEIFSPEIEKPIHGLFTSLAIGFVLIAIAFAMIPSNKNKAIKIYAIVLTVNSLLGFILFLFAAFFDAAYGVVLVSFQAVGFLIGIWYMYSISVKKETDKVKEININDDESKIQLLQNKADKEFLNKDYSTAMRICDEILIIKPDYYNALVTRAMSLENLGYNLDAIDDYEMAISINVDYNNYGLLGLCYYRIGEIQKAILKLELAVKNGFNIYEPVYDNLVLIIEDKETIQFIKNEVAKSDKLKRRN